MNSPFSGTGRYNSAMPKHLLRQLVWPARLAALGLLTASLFGLGGNPSGATWLLDLAAQFRVQYALGLAVCLPVLWVGRSRGWAGAALAGLALNLAFLAPYYRPVAQATADGPGLRVTTVNVLLTNTDDDAVIAALLAADADLIAVSELTPSLAARLDGLRDRYPYQLLEPQDGHYGIGVLSRLPWRSAETVPFFWPELPALRLQLAFDGREATVWAVHAAPPFHPAGHALRARQLAYLAEQVRTAETPVIVLGDLNTTPFGAAFRALLAESGLRDTAVGRGLPPTWRSRAYPFGIAIDHVLVSADFVTRSRAVGPDVGSDHFPLTAEVVWRARP